MVNSSQGGGTKNTWVLDHDRRQSGFARAPPITSTGWRATSRRAEYLARAFLEATLRAAALPTGLCRHVATNGNRRC